MFDWLYISFASSKYFYSYKPTRNAHYIDAQRPFTKHNREEIRLLYYYASDVIENSREYISSTIHFHQSH